MVIFPSTIDPRSGLSNILLKTQQQDEMKNIKQQEIKSDNKVRQRTQTPQRQVTEFIRRKYI